MGQEVFAGIEAGAGVLARGVVQQVEQDLFAGVAGVAGQPGMGAGVVLPECAIIADLPAFDWFGRGFEAGVGGPMVLESPASNTGAVGFEVEAAVQFAGGGAVGRGWFGREQFGKQGCHRGRPVGLMVATGEAGGPGLGVSLGAGTEILAVELVEAGQGKPQFTGGGRGVELALAMIVQDMTNEWGGQTFYQL